MSLLIGQTNMPVTKLKPGDMVFAVADFRYPTLGFNSFKNDLTSRNVKRNDAFLYLGKVDEYGSESPDINYFFLWVRGGEKFQNRLTLRFLLERLEWRPEWKVVSGQYDD